jgi:protein-S-isoprenylcysteine O-methyltransferase Ste14
VHIFGWLICVIYSIIPGYWLLIHPHADYWRAQRSPYRMLLPLWAGMFVLVLGITAPFRKLTIYDTAWSWLPAASLFAIGIWLYKTGSAHFSLQRLQGIPELSREHTNQQLVTSGIRARIRHPIYLAHFSEMLAWTIGTGLVVCLVLSALAILGGIFLIRAEDAELEQRFGDAYRQYRRSVPALFPRLGAPSPRL